MPYKTCRDFETPLKSGDKLDFKVGDANAGSFSVFELPNDDAVLLLVIHRHDTSSTAVSFESHVFASHLHSQIAVIDTYRGSTKALPRILDSNASGTVKGPARSEELRYGSVVAVNPGAYEIDLTALTGEIKAKQGLVALDRESYVVLRTGVESKQGESFPEELVVYPQSTMAAAPHSDPRGPAFLVASIVICLAVLVAAMCWLARKMGRNRPANRGDGDFWRVGCMTAASVIARTPVHRKFQLSAVFKLTYRQYFQLNSQVVSAP